MVVNDIYQSLVNKTEPDKSLSKFTNTTNSQTHNRARSNQTEKSSYKNTQDSLQLTQDAETYYWRNKNTDDLKPVSIQTKNSPNNDHKVFKLVKCVLAP